MCVRQRLFRLKDLRARSAHAVRNAAKDKRFQAKVNNKKKTTCVASCSLGDQLERDDASADQRAEEPNARQHADAEEARVAIVRIAGRVAARKRHGADRVDDGQRSRLFGIEQASRRDAKHELRVGFEQVLRASLRTVELVFLFLCLWRVGMCKWKVRR